MLRVFVYLLRDYIFLLSVSSFIFFHKTTTKNNINNKKFWKI